MVVLASVVVLAADASSSARSDSELLQPAIRCAELGFPVTELVAHYWDLSSRLGFLRNGPERIGERIRCVDPLRGNFFDVEVCSPVFVDQKEERLRV